MLVEAAARVTDAAVAVVVDMEDEENPNCGTACAKPVSERIAAEAVNIEVSMFAVLMFCESYSDYQGWMYESGSRCVF